VTNPPYNLYRKVHIHGGVRGAHRVRIRGRAVSAPCGGQRRLQWGLRRSGRLQQPAGGRGRIRGGRLWLHLSGRIASRNR